MIVKELLERLETLDQTTQITYTLWSTTLPISEFIKILQTYWENESVFFMVPGIGGFQPVQVNNLQEENGIFILY